MVFDDGADELKEEEEPEDVKGVEEEEEGEEGDDKDEDEEEEDDDETPSEEYLARIRDRICSKRESRSEEDFLESGEES